MPSDEHQKRSVRLIQLRDFLLNNKGRRWTTRELADRFEVSVDTMAIDLRDLRDARHTIVVPMWQEGSTNNAVWIVDPDAVLPPLYLTLEQGAASYVAARLLSQQHDERIDGVQSAIDSLVRIMPDQLRPHLNTLTGDMRQRAQGRPNFTGTFAALSQGWLKQRKVKLTYEPPQKRVFTCTFSPYLVEPSGVGYTIYFIGWCDEIGDRRTFKLERIRSAELTDEPFTIPDDFDGPALLRSAWRIMYGEEGKAAHVKLCFSPSVSKRVRETRWHPSEQTSETEHGLIWEADIGDTTEIAPWVRGWGSDCEVLEPEELRQSLIVETRRLMRVYEINAGDQQGNRLDQDLFG
jgi:predicted DNA-binding transcriptional regulator YafY